MHIGKMSSYNKLEVIKRILLRKKLWFLFNAFVMLPFMSWLFFVYLQPIVEAKGSTALGAWLQFWGVTFIIFETVYCFFTFMKINFLRERVESIEWSISNK